jgi:ABC-type dipeptide/oligopeptide/nickel transport system permease subunit
MAGAIIVVAIVVEQVFGYPGWGRIFIDAANRRDFPVLFGMAWVFALIVVLARLAAELIEIAYNHFGRRPVSPEPAEEPVAPRVTIPKGWLVFCLALVFISIMIAFIGPALAAYGYNEIDLANRLAPPSATYILGTDNLGRDVFSRLLFGIRIDLQAGLMFAGILSVVAIGWAVLAAYLRKANNWLGDTLEDVVMLPRDVVCAFPWLVLLLLLMSMVGGGLWQVALIGSLVLLPRAVGMMREAYSSPSEGRGWLYSVLWSIPVMLLLTVAGAILYTSSLSYLGFGIPSPSPELGGMLSWAGRTHLLTAPWMALWPGLVLALLIFLWVMAGDALLERLGFRSKAVWAEVVE